MNRAVEIICVGNELLTGYTLNTNAQWIAAQLTNVGGMVRRVTVVPDEVNGIASSISESMLRKPTWVIITGGLGPTYDDKTLQGLARALSRKLAVNSNAFVMLRKKYVRTNDPQITAPRYKMATMPIGARPLSNPVGHAPAVMIKQGSCTIFSVPGVPREMESVVSKHILPAVKKRVGKFFRYEINIETRGVMESTISPYLDIVVAENPNVYVKSHPQRYSRGVSILQLNVTAEASNRRTAKKYVEKAVQHLKFYIQKTGGASREM